MKMKLAIDASRNRSGGAVAHILGLAAFANPKKFGIDEVHLWTYKKLAIKIPKCSWLTVHTPQHLERGLASQLYWQFFKSASEFKDAGCDIVLNTDAGSIGRFSPSVTMSRDMLSFEDGEMQRYGVSFAYLRLWVLKFVQCWSLSRSRGVIFLTRYASRLIQDSCGKMQSVAIIPHGVNEIFAGVGDRKLLVTPEEPIKVVYVSNTALYKHQWNVVKACALLRDQGFRVHLTLVGGGIGSAQVRLESEISKLCSNHWLTQLEFLQPFEVAEILSNSDIFVFASSCENMPNTLLEGMKAGLPIACSNRGPMPEVLGDGGVYFDPEDVTEIADATKSLILDPRLREKVSFLARQQANQYSWKRCGDNTMAFVSETYKGLQDASV